MVTVHGLDIGIHADMTVFSSLSALVYNDERRAWERYKPHSQAGAWERAKMIIYFFRRITMNRIYILALLLILPLTAYSGTYSGPRKITLIGCHKDFEVCYVSVNGPNLGPTGCSTTSIRWLAISAVNGKNTLALLTSAYMAGKMVNFYVSDTCLAAQSNFPTFDWYSITDQ